MNILHKLGLAKISELENLKADYDVQLTRKISENREIITKLKQERLELENIYEDKLLDAEDTINFKEAEIKALKSSIIGYKSNNTRLKNENNKLKEELEDFRKNYYKKRELPADKTKSKQVPKLKSFSKTSSIAKMMNT